MAVIKLKSGKWQAVISYRNEEGISVKKKKSFDTRREALNYETDFLRSVENISNDLITFEELFEDYLVLNAQTANIKSIEEKRRIKLVFFNELSKLKFAKITKKRYLDTWVTISKMDYSVSYRNKAIAQLKSIANYAYLYYNIENNAKLLEPIKRTSDDKREMSVWTTEEFESFNSHVSSKTLRAYFHFLYYTGARRGEALAVQKSDIKNGSVKITKSIKHFDGGFLPLKTLSSVRDIKLDKRTLNIIDSIMHFDGPFLFGGLTSIGITTIQRSFTKAKKDSGVTDIRLHDLRHSHASLLINKGANIVAVSKRLGHSDVAMTLKVYTHLMKNSEDELIDLLN